MWAEHERRSKELDEAKRVRQEREIVATSLALEKRAQNLEKVKEIDTMNRSLEVKQMHMLKQFSKKIKVDRELKHLS